MGGILRAEFGGVTDSEDRDRPNHVYPFGENNFDARIVDETQHECPIRKAWVRKVCGLPEEES